VRPTASRSHQRSGFFITLTIPALGGKGLQRRERLVYSGVEQVGIGAAEADLAVPVKDEERSSAHAVSVSIDAKAARNAATRMEVSQQWKLEARLTSESHVAVDTVYRNAEESRAEPVKLRLKFLVEHELIAGDGLPVQGIEHQDDWLAEASAQGDARRRGKRQRELRALRPDGQWRDILILVRVLMPVQRPAMPFLRRRPTASNEPAKPIATWFRGATPHAARFIATEDRRARGRILSVGGL